MHNHTLPVVQVGGSAGSGQLASGKEISGASLACDGEKRAFRDENGIRFRFRSPRSFRLPPAGRSRAEGETAGRIASCSTQSVCRVPTTYPAAVACLHMSSSNDT